MRIILRAFYISLLVLALAGIGHAQAPPVIDKCDSLGWTPNMEPDLFSYVFLGEMDGKAMEPYVLAHTLNVPIQGVSEISCDTLGIVPGHLYTLRRVARDTSGNESVPSKPVTLFYKDILPPTPPTGDCIKAMLGGVQVTVCAEIQPDP